MCSCPQKSQGILIYLQGGDKNERRKIKNTWNI